jgi:PhnB protein
MAADPFERLHLLADVAPPAAPDTRFVSRLRARISDALTAAGDLPVVDLPERSTTVTDTALPTTLPDLLPYICVSPAADAIAWYRDVFDAVETIRYTSDDGRIGHAEMRFGNAMIMLSDPYPELDVRSPLDLGGTPFTLHLTVPAVDTVREKAVAAGATIEREPEEQAYGARSMTLRDPFGHRWMVQTPTGNPTIEDVQAATAGYTITTPDEPEAL